MTLNERLEYAKAIGHDVILVKNDNYVSGTYDEVEYAQKNGFVVVGTVTELYKKEI